MAEVKLSREEQELKARIDKALDDDRFVQRRVDTLAQLLLAEPSEITQICSKFPGDYNLSSTKKSGLMVSSTERMLQILEQEKDQIKELLEGGEEDPEAKLEPARKDLLKEPDKVKTDWYGIGHNVSHCYLVLQRTIRKMPNGKEKISMENILRQTESLYTDVCKHQSLPIE